MNDELYMQRALQLAALGLGTVSPNPLVGCVIVKNNQIIGEGYHQQYGEAHAEVNAVRQIINEEDVKGATVYVTLEPCSHYGKTPPCADMLIKKQVKKVVVALKDPNPLVAGNGLNKLQEAGVEVEVGLLEDKAKLQNRRFLTFIQKNRPYIILKWAETADGFIARNNYDSKWISNTLSRKLVHKWRAEEDAIMVGANTAHYDNPKLNVRKWIGKTPLRVIAEHNSHLSDNLLLFQGEKPAMRYRVGELKEEKGNMIFLQQESFLQDLFSDLRSRKVQSIIVEGGALLLHKLIEANLWDEIRLFQSNQTFGEGIQPPRPNGKLVKSEYVLNDTLLTFRNI